MTISGDLLKRIHSDLGIDSVFVKGQRIAVHRCWHFCTDGNAIDYMFRDRKDFVCGMNRIFFVVQRFEVIILAFVLMDTHMHFILYGEYDQCNRFIHEYVRRTSLFISKTHKERHKLIDIPISHQAITDDLYLKTAICYVLRNPIAAGLHYCPYDYPWSSCGLCFRRAEEWTSPSWTDEKVFRQTEMTIRDRRSTFRTKEDLPPRIRVSNKGLIFPGEYVTYQITEKIFRSYKSFNYFMNATKDSEIESKEGITSRLSIPLQELRQYRDMLAMEMFSTASLRNLDTDKRLSLARRLRAKYNCSGKQVCRVCRLVYAEVGKLI